MIWISFISNLKRIFSKHRQPAIEVLYYFPEIEPIFLVGSSRDVETIHWKLKTIRVGGFYMPGFIQI